MLISRTDRGLLANWWFTVDRLLIMAILLMMAAGVLFSMAASPPVALRLGLDHFHFFERQVLFMAPAVVILIAVSFMTPRQARRLSLWGFFIGLGAMLLAMKWGPEIKGAHRWIQIGSLGIQPSEFVKPTFAVVAAWLLSEGRKRPDMPGLLLAGGAFAMFVGLLVLQPDFGQTVLVVLTFAVMLVVYGIPWSLVLGLGAAGAAAGAAAYLTVSHVASRIDRFLNPEDGDTFQVDTAIQAFNHGGVIGTGPGGGTAKQILPDAHTDFVFAVVGEEFGLVACMLVIGLIGFVVVRILNRAGQESDGFVALALTGLVSTFGFQAVINMAVNVSLMPAKGMTLPFISYGGSSLMATALAMGLVLALGRRRPGARVPQPGLKTVAA